MPYAKGKDGMPKRKAHKSKFQRGWRGEVRMRSALAAEEGRPLQFRLKGSKKKRKSYKSRGS